MALAMLFASCKKEEKPEVQEAFSITASIENDGSKTYLEASKVKWIANSDKIDIWDQTVDQNKPRPIVFTCKKVEGTGTEANFTSPDPIDNQGKYWAFYPIDACSGVDKGNNTYTFTMPATQDYKDGGTSFADGLFPMAAHFSTSAKSGVNLQFKNACGILKIHATGNTTITAIKVTDNNHALWGTFSFNIDDREDASKNWGVSAANNSTNHTLTLKINPAITLNNDAKDFYMVLPPGCLSDDFTVEFLNGSDVVKSASGSNKPIGRSKLITANTSIKVITSLTGTTQAISSSPVNWANNDQIKVYDKSNHEVVFAYNSENSNFTCSNGCIDDKGEYWAFYPSGSLTERSGNVFSFTMPSSQNYDPNGTFQRDLLPMAVHYSGTAGSTDITLPFQNAFGVLKISATGNATINAIRVTDNNHALYGNFDMNLTNSEPTVTSENDNTNHTLTLNIDPAVKLTSTPTDFYMILPPGCLNGDFTVDFISGDETVKSAPASNQPISLSAITATATVDIKLVPSFTLGDGTKIEFAPSNLQYRASDKKWRFAPNAWDVVGGVSVDWANAPINGWRMGTGTPTANNTALEGEIIYISLNNPYNFPEPRERQSGWIDLFGWGTSGKHEDIQMTIPGAWGGASVTGPSQWQPWSCRNNGYAGGDYSSAYGPSSGNLIGDWDWGSNTIYYGNGDGIGNSAGTGWRTLSSVEWSYLISHYSYGYAIVGGTYGMVLLPDNFQMPEGLPQNLETFNTSHTSYYNNNYSNIAHWALMEAAGAVFLPAAGWKNNVYNVASVNYHLRYWSSTNASTKQAYFFRIDDGTNPAGVIQDDRYKAMSVRLVRNLSK